eukprot:8954234-Pyramimonas_sp.AAC.1
MVLGRFGGPHRLATRGPAVTACWWVGGPPGSTPPKQWALRIGNSCPSRCGTRHHLSRKRESLGALHATTGV